MALKSHHRLTCNNSKSEIYVYFVSLTFSKLTKEAGEITTSSKETFFSHRKYFTSTGKPADIMAHDCNVILTVS